MSLWPNVWFMKCTSSHSSTSMYGDQGSSPLACCSHWIPSNTVSCLIWLRGTPAGLGKLCIPQYVSSSYSSSSSSLTSSTVAFLDDGWYCHWTEVSLCQSFQRLIHHGWLSWCSCSHLQSLYPNLSHQLWVPYSRWFNKLLFSILTIE